jgi:hypothetical protein
MKMAKRPATKRVLDGTLTVHRYDIDQQRSISDKDTVGVTVGGHLSIAMAYRSSLYHVELSD